MIRFGNIQIDRKNKVINHDGRSVCWESSDRSAKGFNRDVSFRVAECLILSEGKTMPELFDFIYSDDINGGPIMGRNQLDVVMCTTIKPKMAAIGLEVRATKHNSFKIYRIVEPHVARPAA